MDFVCKSLVWTKFQVGRLPVITFKHNNSNTGCRSEMTFHFHFSTKKIYIQWVGNRGRIEETTTTTTRNLQELHGEEGDLRHSRSTFLHNPALAGSPETPSECSISALIYSSLWVRCRSKTKKRVCPTPPYTTPPPPAPPDLISLYKRKSQ